jgi:MFS family permease
MRTIALASLGFGMVVGTVEVGVPAVTALAGSAALGGVLLSAWSVTSVLAGVLYSMRPWPEPLHLRMPVLLGGFAVLVAAMSLTGPLDSLAVLVVAMVAAGALITPQVTAHSLAIDLAAPGGTAAEGFGWVVTAATLGLAAGQSSAGVVVEMVGPPAAFVVGGAAGLVVAVVLWLRRGSSPSPPPHRPQPAIWDLPGRIGRLGAGSRRWVSTRAAWTRRVLGSDRAPTGGRESWTADGMTCPPSLMARALVH